MKLLDAPARVAARRMPRTRSGGVVVVASALAMVPMLLTEPLPGCATEDAASIPAAFALVVVTAVAGLVLVLRVPRTSAIAPAIACGASTSLLGGTAAGWIWIGSQPCVGNALDRELVTLLLVAAGSAAVLATSLWLLYTRDELEPWNGARGVVTATAASAVVLICGAGTVMLVHDAGAVPVPVVVTAVVLPWAGAVALTGWLRRSPAMAVMLPAGLQAAWLLLG